MFLFFLQCKGRRKLWSQNDARSHEGQRMNVSETKLGNLLGEINSEAKTKRQIVVSCSLNPKVYSTKYRDDKIHYNQNDKLGMFRFAHVCA